MDPIRGTDVSLAMAKIVIDAETYAGKVDTGVMNMSLDAMRDSGQQLIEMLETLGRNINIYV